MADKLTLKTSGESTPKMLALITQARDDGDVTLLGIRHSVVESSADPSDPNSTKSATNRYDFVDPRELTSKEIARAPQKIVLRGFSAPTE